jgi:hypothetical protein
MGVRATTAALAASAAAAGVLLFGGCSDDPALTVRAVSTDATRVTGGDVLVRVTGAEAPIAVTVEGEPVEVAFGEPDRDGAVTGLVSGLPEGRSAIEVSAGTDTARLEVTNHPITGPVFSGPHIEPLACTTEDHGLGPPTDDDCSAPTQVRWSYVAPDGEVVSLEDRTAVPDDAATTTLDGTEVPLVVRSESGTINRGVYWIHVLDPAPAEDTWDDTAWSGTLVYRFGGGCGASYSQGEALAETPTVAGSGLDLDMLRLGYAMATNTFNTMHVMCNDVLSAESMMMTKERFAERFGLPERTVGEGRSGGAMQQYLIAQNYPGLLDAVVSSLPFPDAMTIVPGFVDCGLLEAFYASGDGAGWTSEQRRAVNGHAFDGTCGVWASSFLDTIDPTTGCALDDALVYDPDTNPDGARCTITDSNVNALGIDPGTGVARRPIDNVGVQYGLHALRDGVISVDEMLELNEAIGGYDLAGRMAAGRMAADEDALRVLYEGGRLTQGAGDLGRIPIFVLNPYTDPLGDIHDRFRAFTMMERLRLDDGGRAPGYALWTMPGEDLASAGRRRTSIEMIALAVEWLDGLDGPAADRTAEQLEAARPDAAAHVCVTPDGVRHTGEGLYDEGHPCARAYPLAGDPRLAAGAPIESLTLKCQLTDIDHDAYGVELTSEQRQRLAAIFPDGVCDWERPGVGQTDPRGPWLDYSDGPPG